MRTKSNEDRLREARGELRYVIGTLAHNRAFTKREVAEYSGGAFGSKDIDRLVQLGKLERVEGGFYPTRDGWRWIEGKPPLAERTSRSPVSQIVAKKTFYSGDLVLVVHLLEGHHEDPHRRERQVRGCKHNVVYRVSITAGKGTYLHGEGVVGKGTRSAVAVQWVCPPAYLSHAVDSLAQMRSAAHAALSFADDEGWPVEEHAAFSETGWHVGATKLHAWPREKKR